MAAPQRVFVPFGQFTPDLKNFAHEGLEVCTGWAPVHGSYVGAPIWALQGSGWTASGNTLAHGLHAHDLGAGVWVAYLGDVTKLWTINPATGYSRSDTSRTVGGAYNVAGTGGENGWQLASFGQNVVATNYVNEVQAALPGAGTFENMILSGVGGAPGMAPKAKFVFSVGANLFLANCNLPAAFDTLPAGANPNLLAWSQSDNIRQFGSVSITPQLTQAGYQAIENDFGQITGAAGLGEIGVVFQGAAITVVEGPPYQFRTRVRGIGCRYPNSYGAVGTDLYFWSPSGPAVLRNGESVDSLGNGRITRTLIDNSTGFSGDAISASIDVKHVSCGVDIANSLVVWAITPSVRTPLVQGGLILYYNFAEDRFAFTDVIVDTGTAISAGGMLFLGNRRTTSETWLPHRDVVGVALAPSVGGQEFFALTSARVAGPGAMARAYQQLDSQRTTRIQRVRPIYSGSSSSSIGITATIESKNTVFETPTSRGPYPESDGHGWITTPEAIYADFHRVSWAFPNNLHGVPQSNPIYELKGFEIEFVRGPAYAS